MHLVFHSHHVTLVGWQVVEQEGRYMMEAGGSSTQPYRFAMMVGQQLPINWHKDESTYNNQVDRCVVSLDELPTRVAFP
jgi:hypothetical protein